MTLKKQANEILHGLDKQNLKAHYFRIGISSLIIFNALAVMLDTVESIHLNYASALTNFELISVTIFSVEYFTRLWCADLNPHYKNSFGRARYAASPMAIIDLIAILPSLLSLAGLDLRILRTLRLLRLLKLTRYATALETLLSALRSRFEEIAVSGLFMLLLMLFSSSLIYFAEHDAQPDVFTSIPAAWWWSVSTLATIGYGDIYPVTIAGKITAGITAIFGIGLFALPGGIIASALIESARKTPQNCPHCGK